MVAYDLIKDVEITSSYFPHPFRDNFYLHMGVAEAPLCNRCMYTLTDNVILSIDEKIADKLIELFNISFETLVYDITSTYFEGTECDLAKYGYNRDGLSGKLQKKGGRTPRVP